VIVDSAHSALRPRAVVIERISAVVSSTTFFSNVVGTSPPVLVTGDAARCSYRAPSARHDRRA
jgi:hypothetical protein